jgi:hypothetical protein
MPVGCSQKLTLIPLVALLALVGCARAEAPAPARGGGESQAPTRLATTKADAPQAAFPKTTRKVIRKADLTIEVTSPAGAESQVSRLFENLGGYVAASSSEFGVSLRRAAPIP